RSGRAPARHWRTHKAISDVSDRAQESRSRAGLRARGGGLACRDTYVTGGRRAGEEPVAPPEAERSLRFWHTREMTTRPKRPTRPLRRDAQANRDRTVAAAGAAFAAEWFEVPVGEIARRSAVGVGRPCP